MTLNKLIELEQLGVRAMSDRDYESAIRFFRELLGKQPDYEHGLPHYHLACALEEHGALPEARKEYLEAISWAPTDAIRLGGYASFLYLHGEPEEAFQTYLRLAEMELGQPVKADISDIIHALLALGARMGWTESETKLRIERGGITLQ